MSDARPARLLCIACRSRLSTTSPGHCPRCGADNRAWSAWLAAERKIHLRRFFWRSPWGRLALVSLLLPPIAGAALGLGLFTLETLILAWFSVLGLLGLLALFSRRHTLWTFELARRVAPRFRPGLLAWGGAGLSIFLLVAGPVAIDWGLELLGRPPSSFSAAGWRDAVVVLALALVAHTWGAGLYAVYAYGRWLSRTFPRPVFLDQARLLRLVLRATEPRIQPKTGGTYEAVTARLAALSRTQRAGLSLLLRAEAGTDLFWEGHYLKAVQGWRVVADRWGRVTQLKPEGPLEYIPDPGRVYKPFEPGDARKVLDGEIILPTPQTSSG